MENKINFKMRKDDDSPEYDVTLIQWNDKWGHWRLGLNWIDSENYEYIVEKPTIEECLKATFEYINSK